MSDQHKLDKFAVGIYPVPKFPLVKNGDDLGDIIVRQCRDDGFEIKHDDVIVVAQKIVSKVENQVVALPDVVPSAAALKLSAKSGRDPRLCQVYIDECDDIIATKGRFIIMQHRLGFECNSSGVDRSNVGPADAEMVSLLPIDSDISACQIRETIARLTGQTVAVIVSDTFCRLNREGFVGQSIGFCGIRHIEERHQQDLYANPTNSQTALVDELAAAASIVMGQADEAVPVVVIRGVHYTRDEGRGIKDLISPREMVKPYNTDQD